LSKLAIGFSPLASTLAFLTVFFFLSAAIEAVSTGATGTSYYLGGYS